MPARRTTTPPSGRCSQGCSTPCGKSALPFGAARSSTPRRWPKSSWPWRPGWGWIGRQSLLVTPQYGSYVLLGELILTEEADRYDTPFEGSRCGTCRSCIDNCPTGAVTAGRTIDTGRCISCRTIEREQPGETDLHGWIFGCDACQSCCPWNRRAPQHRNAAFDPVFDPLAMDAGAWLGMDEAAFEALCGRTPLTRSGLDRIRRNVRE